jgi:hypothetical protein
VLLLIKYSINNSEVFEMRKEKNSKSNMKVIKDVAYVGGWIASPPIMAAVSSIPDKHEEFITDGAAFVGAVAYGLTWGISSLLFWGGSSIYHNIEKKEYEITSQNISIRIDQNLSSKYLDERYDALNRLSAMFPPIKILMIKNADDLTSISTNSMYVEVASDKVITFDKNKGYSANVNECYINDIYVLTNTTSKTHSPSRLKNLINEYLLRVNDTTGRRKALENGDLKKLDEMKSETEWLKKKCAERTIDMIATQNIAAKYVSEVVEQLNNDYFGHKVTVTNTALPGRDYDESRLNLN